MHDSPCDSREKGIRKTLRTVYGLTVFGTIIWIGAIFLAPVLKSRSAGRAAAFLYSVFSPICHQIPGRSFFFHGFPLAVCGRCLGIYVGFLAGLVLYPFVRGFSGAALPSLRLFMLLSLPIGLDFAGNFLGLWNSSNAARFSTGLLWGCLLPFYFVTGVAEPFIQRISNKAGCGAVPGRRLAGLDNSGQKNVE